MFGPVLFSSVQIPFFKIAYRSSKKEFFAATFAFFVAFFVFLTVDSLSRAVVSQVELEARPVLGADLLVTQNAPFSSGTESAVFKHCETYSATCSKRVSFSSTFFDSQGKTALVRVVGAQPGQPYYGDFRIRTPDGREFASVVQNVPTASGYLADAAFAARFSSGGELDFFRRKLRQDGEILESSESSFSFGEESGSVFISYETAMSLPEISTLSRADFSILIRTPNEFDADRMLASLRSDGEISARVRSFRWGAWGAARVVDDVTEYVSQAVSVVFFLAGTAAFFFSRAVWTFNRKTFSILRLLWASRLSVSAVFVGYFASAALLAALFAFFSADAATSILSRTLSGFWSPQMGWNEAVRLLWVLPFVLVPAAVPGIVSVFKTPPLSGLAEPKASFPKLSAALLAAVSAFFASVAFLRSISGLSWEESLQKSLVIVGFIAAILALSHAAIRLTSRFLKHRLRSDFASFDAVRLAVAPGSPAFPVVSAFVVPAVLFASFASLAFHFSDELDRLSSSGYDVFALNLSEDSAAAVVAEYPQSESYSIIRARISKINGKTLSEHFGENPSREFTREFNVTSSFLPEAVIRGDDRPVSVGEVSLDDEFSRQLGVNPWDRITFSVMGREFELFAVNVRQSLREGIRPFFYFSVAPREFGNVPLSYFVAASTEDVEGFKSFVLKSAGNSVSFVDVRETVAIARSSAEKIVPAVWAFLFAVGALSVTVGISALSSLSVFRAQREKTYRAIGADRRFLRRQAIATLAFYSAAAFLAAAIVAFPAVWGGILSVSFLEFSPSAATKAVGVLFAFLVSASLAVAAFERRS